MGSGSLVTKPVLEIEPKRPGRFGGFVILVGVNHEKMKLHVGTKALDEFARLGPTGAQLKRSAAVGVGAYPDIVTLRANHGFEMHVATGAVILIGGVGHLDHLGRGADTRFGEFGDGNDRSRPA